MARGEKARYKGEKMHLRQDLENMIKRCSRAILDMVVKKSEGYSVEQLERLYSLLSQCIYQHRREYDKTQLLEEMEERIQHFDTFL